VHTFALPKRDDGLNAVFFTGKFIDIMEDKYNLK